MKAQVYKDYTENGKFPIKSILVNQYYRETVYSRLSWTATKEEYQKHHSIGAWHVTPKTSW